MARQQIADYEAILNPKRVVAPWAEKYVDCLSWMLPATAAACSVFAGITVLLNEDKWAAWLTIGAGFLAAVGVLFANVASRIRDQRLEHERNVGALTMEIANDAASRAPSDF